MMLEERLEIATGDQENEGCLTVGRAMRLLDRKLSERSRQAA